MKTSSQRPKGVTTMGRLANKNILITGGNSGIGLAAAQEFDREGARVAICGLNEGTLQAAKETPPSATRPHRTSRLNEAAGAALKLLQQWECQRHPRRWSARLEGIDQCS